MRIENTQPERRPTRRLYDEETMSGCYDPPGITFNENDGAVAQIRADCADAVVEKFDHFTLVDEPDESGDADDSGEQPPDPEAADAVDERFGETDSDTDS